MFLTLPSCERKKTKDCKYVHEGINSRNLAWLKVEHCTTVVCGIISIKFKRYFLKQRTAKRTVLLEGLQ